MLTPSLRWSGLVGALLIAALSSVAPGAQTDELQEANQAFKQGQLDRASERVDAYLKTRPKDARGRFLKGIILAEQNRPNDAIAVFSSLTQDYPELPEPYNNLAVLYASQGQYDKARAALEMAIRTHPSYATAHENLGDIYAKMASQAYDKALQLDKGNTAAQIKLNLIKDLFSASPRAPKPTVTGKAEPSTKVAVATPKAPERVAVAPPASKAPEKAAAAAKAAPKEAAPKAEPARNPSDFLTPKGEPRAKWESERKTRIAKPRRIQVLIESPKVVFTENNRVRVTFRQNYRSDTLTTSSTKTLVMVKAGDKWLIQQEKVGG
jgi:tetratricopeptide (TPR) repeat protein